MTRSREVSKGATRNEFIYTATATQTTFSGNDDSSNSLSYTAGQIDVFLNGSRLAPADFTATNGTSVVLGSGAVANDIVQINAFGTFSVADVIVDRLEFDYTATAGQTTFTGSDNDSQTMAYTAGRIDVYLNGSRLNVTDDYVATNGTSVVLEAGAQAGDSLVVVAHGTVNLASNILSGDLDLNGNELILDVDGDTTITADTDDQIDIKIAGADDFAFKANKFEVQTGSDIDMNGTELILDADGDTSITADTDDQIDIKIGGTDFAKLTDGQLTLTSATASRPGIVLESTNADANPAFLRFQKNGSSPADNDEVGLIAFYADDDGGNVFIPAQIKVTTPDVTDSTENGRINMDVNVDGTLATRLSINDLGRVSSGTASPGHTAQFLSESTSVDLFVGTNNDGKRFAVDGNGQIYSTASTSITSLSDQRLKENIENIPYGLAEIVQLSPKKFNFISTPDIDEYGFLAQDVESILPELVDEQKLDATIQYDENGNSSAKDSTAYKTLKMGDILPVLVKAVQELKTENDSLKARIKTLEDA